MRLWNFVAESNPLESSVPPVALWLGGFGAVPFVVLAIANHVVEPPLQGHTTFALTAYGATILSFLGGVHWGLAIADSSSSKPGRKLAQRLTVSVLPSLVAWCALLLPISLSFSLWLLAASFVLMLAIDLRATYDKAAPIWYPRLRWPLSIVVFLSLCLGALA